MMNKLKARALEIVGYDVEEHDPAPLESKPFGAVNVGVKTSLAVLHDVSDPPVHAKRDGLVIGYGSQLAELFAESLSPEEYQLLAKAIARRAVREMHDHAMEVSNEKRARLARLTKGI